MRKRVITLGIIVGVMCAMSVGASAVENSEDCSVQESFCMDTQPCFVGEELRMNNCVDKTREGFYRKDGCTTPPAVVVDSPENSQLPMGIIQRMLSGDW